MIKFRAWDKATSSYRKVLEIEFYPDGELKKVKVAGLQRKGAITPDKLVLEQFTGLTDVNGKEIYEGDIIQYSDQFYEYSMGGVTDLETEYIGIVVKNNWSLGILINRISHTDAHINHYNAKEFVPFCEFDDPESDVLLKGNAHENPDLLEADK